MTRRGVDVDKHPLTTAEPYLPEFYLVVTPEECRGTVFGHYELYSRDDEAWQTLFMSGGATLRSGAPVTVVLQ